MRSQPLWLRIWRWVTLDTESSCWLWTGSYVTGGYGQIARGNGRGMVRAHRAMYEFFHGPIPEGLQLDHLCRVRRCVNPDHLEPVTQAENIRRGMVGSNNSQKTHCVHGHEFTPENIYWKNDRWRECRKCVARAQREYQARKRAAGADPAVA